MRDLADRMGAAARSLLESLTPEQRSAAVTDFDVPERTEWTYLPGQRPGLRVAELSPEQRDRVSALLTTSYSERGQRDLHDVVRVEALREGIPTREQAASLLEVYAGLDYWVRILGDPGAADAWMWRLSGHHLVAQATVHGDTVSLTPQFFGAQPARFADGPHAGFRGLGPEEDLARTLVRSLGDDQRLRAVTSALAPDDILSRHDPYVTAWGDRGLEHAAMDSEQRRLFEALVGQYLHRVAAPVANRAWGDLQQAGIGRVTFSWAGGLDPGAGHYYALVGPTLLIEYDNTQNDANHIHSVWRNPTNDWGGDVLSRHYAQHPHAHPSPPVS